MNRRQFLKHSLRAFTVFGVSKGMFNSSRFELTLDYVPIQIDGLPLQFKGTKIAVLSDIHSSLLVGKDLIATAAKMAMEARPDMIVLLGDFISGRMHPKKIIDSAFDVKYVDVCADALSTLRAPMGIYGVLGNHDFWGGDAAIEAICTKFTMKFRVEWLRNSAVELTRQGGSIYLLGVDDFWEQSCSINGAYEGLDRNSVKILLSHNPDINAGIDPLYKKIDIVLSGHTHGGQVVLPIIGSPFLPSVYGQRYRIGLIEDNGRRVYVTRGIGHTILPIRYNCPPEVTIIVLT
ncbi:MAG: metallophosphoesterase [Nitrospirae bacterium]|nr:metallophosphoesterase [Nitrospirota bacterium]